MLEAENLNVHYGDFHVLHDLSLCVNRGEAVGLIGANGHGKSTLLKAICGLIPSTSGTVTFKGQRIDGISAPQLVRNGLIYVAEERNLFADMTVLENLNLGAYVDHARTRRDESLELVFELYPRLSERRKQLARTLSGGEAQMLALGRGLMSSADFMAIDEPSLGLAPNLVDAMMETIHRINQRGITVLLVEQQESLLEGFMSRVYTLEEGRIVGATDAGQTDTPEMAER